MYKPKYLEVYGMKKLSIFLLLVTCFTSLTSCSDKINLSGNENTEAISYNGVWYPQEDFYCAEDDMIELGRVDGGGIAYGIGLEDIPKYIFIYGYDNSRCFIAEGCSVPTSGKITKVLVDPAIRGDKSKYLSTDDELAVVQDLVNLSGEEQTYAVDNYYSNGNSFYYVYNDSNVSCKANYGGYVAYTHGTWIYAPPENSTTHTDDAPNSVTIDAIAIEDEDLIDRICQTDIAKDISDVN
jgi:hypothetical protein